MGEGEKGDRPGRGWRPGRLEERGGKKGGLGKVGALCGRRPPLGRGEWEETPGEKGMLAGFPGCRFVPARLGV